MKRLCENMLVPSMSNWADLLRASELLDSLRMRQHVIAFLRDNFSVLQENLSDTPVDEDGDEFHDAPINEKEIELLDSVGNLSFIQALQEEYPGLLEEVLQRRQILSPAPPSKALVDLSISTDQAKKDAIKTPKFPLWTLFVAVGALIIYQRLSKVVSLGIVIPTINVIATAAVAAYIFRIFNRK